MCTSVIFIVQSYGHKVQCNCNVNKIINNKVIHENMKMHSLYEYSVCVCVHREKGRGTEIEKCRERAYLKTNLYWQLNILWINYYYISKTSLCGLCMWLSGLFMVYTTVIVTHYIWRCIHTHSISLLCKIHDLFWVMKYTLVCA